MIPRLADSASTAPCTANDEPPVGEGMMISSESRIPEIRTSGSTGGAPPGSCTAAETMEQGMISRLADPAHPPGSRTAIRTMERAS